MCSTDAGGGGTVIPISLHQDTVGPMTRSVADAAALLNVIAGRDPLDNYTDTQPDVVPDFTKALQKDGLRGVHLGVVRAFQGSDEDVIAVFNASLRILEKLGATIVDPTDYPATEELQEIMLKENLSVVYADLKVKIATLARWQGRHDACARWILRSMYRV
jgi:amidase